MRPDRLFLSALVLASALTATGARADCAPLIEEARTARGDANRLEEIFARSQRACRAEETQPIGQLLGFALFNRARLHTGAEQIMDLRRAAQVARDWRIFAALGNLENAAGNHEAAARNLQFALLELQDRPPNPLPPEKTVRRLITMANNARAASPVYVRAVKTRKGAPGATTASEVAGVQIETVPFPIEFDFGTTDLTEQSIFAVEDLASLLAEVTEPVTLAGHTDPVGSELINDALSIARAEKIRSELVAKGVTTPIQITGCGERHPPVIEDPGFYTQDETHQIMRRVELVRSGSPCR